MSSKDFQIADAITNALNSPNVSDSNGEAANVVDVLQRIANGTGIIADAITPRGRIGKDASGGHIESLTEAVMGMTAGLCRIADALESVAQAIEATKDVS